MNAVVRAPLDGEILGPAEVITVTAAVHPLKPQAEIIILPAGLSLAEVVAEVSQRCHVSRLARGADVSISGQTIDRVLWGRVRVKAGAHVTVRARAGKGIGNILKSLLMIALSVAATFIVGPGGLSIAAAIGGTAGQIAASVVAGAIMTAGGLALNALFPPSQTKSQDQNQSYSISAGRNGATKWGAIPSVLGKVRARPKYAAMPYTEFDGDDQYLRLLFVWGYGPIKVEDIKIGDTSISEFGDVQIETFEGYADDGNQTIYPSEVVQDDLSIEPEQNVAVTRASAEDANEIVLDFVAPAGIGHVTNKGKFETRSVSLKIEFRLTGSTGAWTNKGNVELSGKSNDVLRRSWRYPVTKGQYDVRATRLTVDSAENTDFDTVTWTAIKTFRTAPPIDFRKPLAITAIRIRATKQLNGVVDNLNALVTTVAKKWTGSAWAPAQQTRNPADLFRHVLQGPANARPQADSRIDLASLAAWADLCSTRGYSFDMYRDFTASVRDTLRDIAAAGRAIPVFKDGKWSVAWEDDDAPVVQHFTPRNSRDFRWVQSYRVMPHGLRCKFVNAAKDYIEDEILVFDDGYTKENATLYEQAEFPGVTSAEIVYKHGLYRIADAKERPGVYTLTVDFEHLVAQRADRVAVAHDVILQGIASGRVKAVNGQKITLDEPAVMEAGKSYGIRVRRASGVSSVLQVTTVAGVQPVITVTGAPPAVGDLYTFGNVGHETGIYRILRIRPGADLSAEIDLVDDGDNVQAGDSSTDIPGGSAKPITPLTAYTPTNLRAASLIVPRPNGNVHVVRIYWQAASGPEYVSFEVVGTSEQGTVRMVVDGSEQVAEFEGLQSSLWTFTVRGLLKGGKYTLPSAPLIVPVDVPYDDVGIAKDNLVKVVQDLLDSFETDIDATAQALIAEAAARDEQFNADRAERLVNDGLYADHIRDLIETVGQQDLRINETVMATVRNQTIVRQEVADSAGESRAYTETQIDLAVGPNSALAAQLLTLAAEIAGVDTELGAAVTQLTQAIADGDAGSASALEALKLQVRGSYGGGDLTQVTEGLLYQLNQARISDNEALATAIALVSAGLGILYDSKYLWSYDTSVEDWTGNGAPTASGGYLRPANHATDPYVVSPAGLAVVATAYRQVKLYVRKTGAPVWEGQVWYKRTGDSTWDAARRSTLAEPIFDVDGRAVATWDMDWDGEIDQIRLDLSTAQTDSDYFRIDWSGIGRPSPGASRADVANVQEALTTAIAAEASRRETLSTILVGQADPAGVTLPTAGGLIRDERNTRAAADQALSESVIAVQARLENPATGLDALAGAQSAMRGDITDIDGRIDINATNIADAVSRLANKAETSVTDDLRSQISALGGGDAMVLMASAVRSLQVTASQQMLNQAGLFLNQKQLNTDLANATAGVQQAMESRIDITDKGIDLLSQSVLLVNARLDGKADASVLVDYYTKIQTDGLVTNAVAGALIDVNASLNDVLAGGLISFKANPNPGPGIQSQIDIAARASAGGAVATAATFYQVYSEGGVLKTRQLSVADQFAFVNGNDVAALFQKGTLFFDNGRFRNLTGDVFKANSIDAAVVMQNGTIITELIATDQLTGKGFDSDTVSGSLGSFPGTWRTCASFTCTNPNPNPPLLFYRLRGSLFLNPSAGSISMNIRFVRKVGASIEVLNDDPISLDVTTSIRNRSVDTKTLFTTDPDAPQGTYTYEVQYFITNNFANPDLSTFSVTGDISGQWAKR